jgi:prefoldin subunit 5
MQHDSMQKTLQDTREALQRLQRQVEQQQQQIERLLEAAKNVRR